MRLPRFIAVPGVRASQYFHGLFGFEVADRKPPVPGIKDAEFYRPTFTPWLMEEWAGRLRAGDPRSLVPLHQKYILYNLALDATRRCSGDSAECGVYKGGTAKILAEIVPDRPLYLFDTFSGMPETDPTRDLHKAGDFADTSIEAVKAYLAEHENTRIVQGQIPGTLEVIRDREFVTPSCYCTKLPFVYCIFAGGYLCQASMYTNCPEAKLLEACLRAPPE